MATQAENMILAAIPGLGIAAALLDTWGRPLWLPNWLVALLCGGALVAAYDWSGGQGGFGDLIVLFVVLGVPLMLVAYGMAKLVIRYFGRVMW